MPCHSRWSIVHMPRVSIQLCPVLLLHPSPSAPTRSVPFIPTETENHLCIHLYLSTTIDKVSGQLIDSDNLSGQLIAVVKLSVNKVQWRFLASVYSWVALILGNLVVSSIHCSVCFVMQWYLRSTNNRPTCRMETVSLSQALCCAYK